LSAELDLLLAKRLIDRHGLHMKATGMTLQELLDWNVGFLTLSIPILDGLILDYSDVRHGRGWTYLPF
jgi:hypothetical protein